MISIERCKEILGDSRMPDSEVMKLREALYTSAESILDNYFKEFATIDICKKQSSTAEFLAPGKVPRVTASTARNIGAENTHNSEATRL